MPLKLRPISYLVLGMVRFGATSGYAIKKAADAGTRAFWPTSLAQVYPELSRLEEAGLLNRSDDSHGARSRARYELTGKGEQALVAWLHSSHEAPMQMRYEGMLRMFFSDALPLEDRLALFKRQQQRVRDLKAHMFDGDLRGAAKAIDAGEMPAPILLGDFAEDLLDFIDEYAERTIERLEAQIAGAGGSS